MTEKVNETIVENEQIEQIEEEVKEEKKGFLDKVKGLKKAKTEESEVEEKPKKSHKKVIKGLALAAGAAVVAGLGYALGRKSNDDSDEIYDDEEFDRDDSLIESSDNSNEENA